MAISFDNALGIHPLALRFREKRTELIAANLANVDTPNYKARDMDFQSVLKGLNSSSSNLNVTQANHMQAHASPFAAALQYRNPGQASLDGNTVEGEREQMNYAQNALQYQATLQFLGEDFKGLKTAIRGD